MGWFTDLYGDVAPKLPIDDFLYIYDNFGEEAAIDTSKDVQEEKISVKTLEKYLYDNK